MKIVNRITPRNILIIGIVATVTISAIIYLLGLHHTYFYLNAVISSLFLIWYASKNEERAPEGWSIFLNILCLGAAIFVASWSEQTGITFGIFFTWFFICCVIVFRIRSKRFSW